MMLDEEAYRFLEISQCDGSYPELLERIAPQVKANVEREIVQELYNIKDLPASERLYEINCILKYWSRARDNEIKEGKPLDSPFEETSMNLTRASKYSISNFEQGEFEPEILANRLIRACYEYDQDVIIPLTEQISTQLFYEFPSANFLFLGRDFTSVYLYLHASKTFPLEQLFLANISRNVRDACLEDSSETKLRELQQVLYRCGLNSKILFERPLVIVDSSMKGKIPAVIFQALSIDMDDRDAFQFLTRAHIRYIRSGRKKGKPLHQKAMELGGEERALSRQARKEIFTRIELIEEFKKIHFPPEVASFIPRRHKIFEWRPKTLQVATGTMGTEPPSLTSELPTTKSQKIMCLLGLMLDVQMQEAGKSFLSNKNPIDREYVVPPSLVEVKKEIDSISIHGIGAIRSWQRKGPKNEDRLSIVETKDEQLPYELYLGKNPLIRLRSIAGEGNNVLAYVTERDTVLKVSKKPSHARKNLLLAWAENLVREVGVDVAPVLQVGPEGLYVEQEYIPGDNLETRFSEEFEKDPKNVPQEIVEQILETFYRASRLIDKRGIYLDIKSANYQLRDNGKIVNVDYTPRVNKTYYRYFRKDDGSKLKPQEFLDMFFCHDRRKRCLRK